jgi:hypothetical protein
MSDYLALDPIGAAELARFADLVGLTPTALEAGRDLGMEGRVTPDDAHAILAWLPMPSRQMLARAVALYMVLEEIPPLSLAPTLASHAGPLVTAGLAMPASARDQALYNGRAWGVVPEGLPGIAVTIRTLGLVTALLSAATQDGFDQYNRALDDYGRFRLFS